MKYLSIAQTAERWGISTRRIQILCGEGRVPGHSGRTTIPAFLICSCAAYLYSFSKLQFVSLLYFQQFPDLGLPRFQFGNVILVEMPGAVNAAANLIDVRGDAADGGS